MGNSATSKPLRVLLVEDSEDDAALVLHHLETSGYSPCWERVCTPEAMRAALGHETPWDVVLADYHMPRFSAPAAFRVLKDLGLDIPFIIISGTVGEEAAVQAMRAGAQDYLLKGQLARLVPAVERELREARSRAEQRQLQEQLFISDRMASIGMLAAGVAHEINNPLAAVMANLEFALQDLAKLSRGQHPPEISSPDGAPRVDWQEWLSASLAEVEDPLRDAQKAAESVRLIVRDLKVFSRSGDEVRRGPVDIHRVLESSLRLAWNEIRHRARLVKVYGEIPWVWGNESRLGQVFLNLLVNAAQALPEGRVDRNEIRIVTSVVADHVMVEVRDSGMGIPPEVLPRIFDPFFTTKPAGIGTGLGLAICNRIVTDLGGTIGIESVQGRGTRCLVRLPISQQEIVEEQKNSPVRVFERAVRRGRILVVDDDAMIANALRRVLATEHEVTTVVSVRDALEHLSTGQVFDVILCDLMMPELTGMDFYTELSGTAPEQAERMVFMTGGAFTPVSREFLDRVPNARIEKPFDMQNLHAHVRGLLR